MQHFLLKIQAASVFRVVTVASNFFLFFCFFNKIEQQIKLMLMSAVKCGKQLAEMSLNYLPFS